MNRRAIKGYWAWPLLALISACAGEDVASPAMLSREEVRIAAVQSSARDLALSLETVAVSRGAAELDVAVLGVELDAGVFTRTRAQFAEIVQGGADSAEQSWRFAQAPGSAGALTITVSAAGLDYLEATGDGLRFRTGDLDVRYGHGTWVDADQHRWAVPARREDHRILLTVPAAVVAGTTFPAVLDPIIVVSPSNNPT